MSKIENNCQEAITIKEFVETMNGSVTRDNVMGRIRRGSIIAVQNEKGEWLIPQTELERVLNEVEPCDNCTHPATSYVIVKYHHHHRVEFPLCDRCASQAEKAYSRKGGVLEVVSYPMQSEGWLKP